MHVAILKETEAFEHRVAATPTTIKKLIALGMDPVVQSGAGSLSGFPDNAYKDAGATIKKTVNETVKNADIILKVRRPLEGKKGENQELDLFPEGCILIGLLDGLTHRFMEEDYDKKKIKAFSMDLIPRITRAQSMDVLSSQSNLAGYRAVIEAAAEIKYAFPMMMTAAGTVAPVRVVVLGAGVAGLQAIATARRLGAIVSAFDVRAAAKEQVESLGATFIQVESDENSETAKGYAKETSKDYQKRQAAKIHDVLKKNTVAICTALIPGRAAPVLITNEMIKDMAPGSVIVDMATSAGGNVTASQCDKVISTKNDVKIIGYSNLASRICGNASELYAKNILNFLTLLYDKGDKKITIDLEDEIVSSTLISKRK